MPARIAALEAELARVNEARGADADEVAQMLVRIADAERTNTAYQDQAAAFDAKVLELGLAAARQAELEDACEAMRRDLEVAHGRARRDGEALELARERTRQDAEALRSAQERTRQDAEALEAARERMRQDAEALQASQQRTRRDAEALQAVQERARQDLEALHAAEERTRKDADALLVAQERMRQDAEAIREWQERGRRDAEAAELASHRADLAEHAAAEGARALQAAHEERDADRTRLTELEGKLARTRREYAEEAASLRTAHAEAELEAAHALEEERSAAARARQQFAAAEADLASMRDRVQQAGELLDAIERRDEMAIAMRARAVEEVRRTLADRGAGPQADPSGPAPAIARSPSKAPLDRSGDEPSLEVMSLDELEIDLPE
jgi:hypothetical protein